jgi:DNA-binding response OmpR family regulator
MNKIKILIVEDNEADVVLIKESLKLISADPDIVCVNDGERAIHYLSDKDEDQEGSGPGLVLLDINLPRQSGHEVLKHIRSREKTKHMPVIMLSTSGAPRDIMESYTNGANSYIVKPIDLNEFIESMKQFSQYWLKTVQLPAS